MKPLKNVRRKVMAGAIASAISGVAMISAPAQAMNIAQDGLGEVLLFPYYTVRGGFDTLLSVTNTSDRTVLFKVRWREARNSREVRDFNVALSPHDVWTAGVTISGADGAVVRTFDNSCTSPPLPAGGIEGSREVAFTSIGYDGSDAQFPYDNGGRNASRVQEGYFEIIEMGISSVPESSITSTNTIEFATQHVNGTPRNCAAFDAAFAPFNAADAVWANFQTPRNVLMGGAALINVETGKAYDAAPTAIQNFQEGLPIIFAPGDQAPSLADGTNTGATMFLNIGGVSQVQTITITEVIVPASVEVVSALLHATNLMNEFAAGGTETSGAKTSWVVTFPTKNFYTDLPLPPAGSTAPAQVEPPFAQNFRVSGQSCDSIAVALYNREEGTERQVNQTSFSPAPSGPGGVSLCNEVNVLTFTPSATPAPVLDSSVALGVNTTNVGSSGWANVTLVGTPTWAAVAAPFTGLPAIGFNLIGRDNTADAGNNRNYASGSPHARTVLVPPN